MMLWDFCFEKASFIGPFKSSLCVNPFPNYKFFTLPNWKTLQMTITSLMKMAESYPTARKHCGKRRKCYLRAISPFPTVFSKDFHCRHIKTRACLGKG